jgi:pyruvate dehydrogenase E2 component (dihydrolipoamide acetyltransferase)
MRQEILMPALAADMTQGNLVRWLKGEGDVVGAGDALAEIETDKATVEMEAPSAGRLHKILVPAGTEAVPVNTPMAVLVDIDAQGDEAPAPSPQRIYASPIARRLANEAELELQSIKGSGPGGRIVKADIQALIESQSRAIGDISRQPPDEPRPVDERTGPYTPRPNSSTRKAIARRLSNAKQTIPHFYLTIDCGVGELLSLRTALNGLSKEIKLSVNDFAVYAAALALVEVPAANASWTESAILQYEQVDISVAVSTERGLLTPVVKNAARKTLVNTAIEIRDLAALARAGKLKPEDYGGGTFTVTNLGKFGVREFAAIINPPQACILALGAVEQRPVVRGGSLAIAALMTCTLSADHRVIDGALAAQFLAAFKRRIEAPLSMLL